MTLDAPDSVERALMDSLFSDEGRADPQAVLRSSPAPGRRYRFVHDPRFVASPMPESPDLMFRTVARFMARLPRDRQRAVRRHFTGLFTPRRVERYRATVAGRANALIDVLPASGTAELVTNCLLFVLARHATATTLSAESVHLLDRHRAQLERLLAEPSGRPIAVEELRRFGSPTTLTGATALQDAEAAGWTNRAMP